MTIEADPTPTAITGTYGTVKEWTPATLGPLASLPTQWAIENYLPWGEPGILAGPSAEGKTYISLQMGGAKAAGFPIFGIPVSPAPVLFIELEDSPRVIAKRLESIAEGFPAAARRRLQENFKLWTPGIGLDPRFSRLSEAIAKRLLELGVQPGDGAVVFIDTLAAVSEGDENAAGSSRELWAMARWLSEEFGVVVVFLHHHRKSDPRTPWKTQGLEALRGSSAQGASTRFVLQLTRSKRPSPPDVGHFAKLTVVKISCGRPGFSLDLVQDPRTGLWSRLEDNEPQGSITRGAAYRARSPTPEIPVRKRLLQLLAETAKGEALPSRQQLSISLFGEADHASLAKLRAAFRDLRLKGWVNPDQDILTQAGHVEHSAQISSSISTQTDKEKS